MSELIDFLNTILLCCSMMFFEWQSLHDELEAKFYEEKAALEAKYQKLYEPMYTKVHDMLYLLGMMYHKFFFFKNVFHLVFVNNYYRGMK